jgi:hypothetical protein
MNISLPPKGARIVHNPKQTRQEQELDSIMYSSLAKLWASNKADWGQFLCTVHNTHYNLTVRQCPVSSKLVFRRAVTSSMSANFLWYSWNTQCHWSGFYPDSLQSILTNDQTTTVPYLSPPLKVRDLTSDRHLAGSLENHLQYAANHLRV